MKKQFTKENCPYSHKWGYLNKRTELNIIVAFCNYCDYVDEEYTILQLAYKKRGDKKDLDILNKYIDEGIPRKRATSFIGV